MNLTDIKGIGETYAKKLKKAGITGVQDLRDMNIVQVAHTAGLGEKLLQQWQERARQVQLLAAIKGIGPTYEKKREKQGVHTLDDLAQADCSLAAKLGVSEKRFQDWAHQAQQLIKPHEPVTKKALVAEEIGPANATITIQGKTALVKIKEKQHEKVPVFRGAGMEELVAKEPLAVHIDSNGTTSLWFNGQFHTGIPVTQENMWQRIKRMIMG